MGDISSITGDDAATVGAPVAAYLHRLHEQYAGVSDGEVASYIPELSGADPGWFGIVVATADGTIYEVGDTHQSFTIQSISKAFSFAVALDQLGPVDVHRRVGVEPTGEAFNSITLDPRTGRPLNPMVNAGAISIAGVLADHFGDASFERVAAAYSAFAGRTLGFDEAVYSSERDTGHRNRATAHLLKGSGALNVEPESAVDLYFRQCSVTVEAHDLAVMAATLANGGLNPLSGERVVERDTVRRVLTVMASCGMYDGAGDWLYTVGLPAKSGVGGGIIAVLPGELGIAVFSPPLDAHGNSVRGTRVCRDFSRDMDLHLMRAGDRPASPVRSVYTLAQVGSRRQRSDRENLELAASGGQAVVLELQGSLDFAAGELITRRLSHAYDLPRFAVLDFRRVHRIQSAVALLLAEATSELAARDGALLVSGLDQHPGMEAKLRDAVAPDDLAALRCFSELDLALEWCESELVGCSHELELGAAVELRDHALLDGLTPEQIARVELLAEPRRYAAGAVLAAIGSAPDELLLITSGHASVSIELGQGELRRVATLTAGALLGEMALVNRSPRVAEVVADTEITGLALPADITVWQREDADLRLKMLVNLIRLVADRYAQARKEFILLAE